MLSIDHFIKRYFQDAQPYGNPVTDMSVNCPFCDDTKGHLNISLSKQVCHCFKCDYKASWVKLVMDVTGFTYHRALNELYFKPKLSDEESIIGRFHHQTNALDASGSIAKLPEDFELLIRNHKYQASVMMKYIESRGFSTFHIRKYNLGMSESYPFRVIIPIEEGYWQGRAIVPWLLPKYINPKAKAGSVIFNSKALEMFDEIVVCEGAFSAMAIGSNAIALIGKEPTPEKVHRIIQSDVKTIIIALEQEAYGSMQVLMDAAVSNDKKVIVWKYNVGDPADSMDFEVLEYNLKTKVALRLES